MWFTQLPYAIISDDKREGREKNNEATNATSGENDGVGKTFFFYVFEILSNTHQLWSSLKILCLKMFSIHLRTEAAECVHSQKWL